MPSNKIEKEASAGAILSLMRYCELKHMKRAAWQHRGTMEDYREMQAIVAHKDLSVVLLAQLLLPEAVPCEPEYSKSRILQNLASKWVRRMEDFSPECSNVLPEQLRSHEAAVVRDLEIVAGKINAFGVSGASWEALYSEMSTELAKSIARSACAAQIASEQT